MEYLAKHTIRRYSLSSRKIWSYQRTLC